MQNLVYPFLIVFLGFSFVSCSSVQQSNTIDFEQKTTENSAKIKALVLDLNTKAENGDAYSQYLLGLMYRTGEAVPLDYGKSFFWLMKASQNGLPDAQRNLGYLYQYGQGVQQDNVQAVFWFRKAAEQGLADAQVDLGYSYNQGIGVPQNSKIAADWYIKAAMQGNAWGQHNLARCYIDGRGVPQNYIYAYAWSSLAAAQGHNNAQINRDIVANNFLKPGELSIAQELSAKLQYKIDNPTENIQQNIPSDKIKSPEAKLRSSGTGFLISKDGYILTCHHVIADSKTINVVIGKEILPAQVVGIDKFNDLAILKISGYFSALAFSNERNVKMGQEVFTIGYPNPGFQGVNAKLTRGYISSLSGFQDDIRLYQISTPVQPGNSGGPLIDNNGNVIGVIVAMLDAKTVFQTSGTLPQNVNYAIKSSYASAMLRLVHNSNYILPTPLKTQDFSKAVETAQKCIVMILAFE